MVILSWRSHLGKCYDVMAVYIYLKTNAECFETYLLFTHIISYIVSAAHDPEYHFTQYYLFAQFHFELLSV